MAWKISAAWTLTYLLRPKFKEQVEKPDTAPAAKKEEPKVVQEVKMPEAVSSEKRQHILPQEMKKTEPEAPVALKAPLRLFRQSMPLLLRALPPSKFLW